MSEQFERDYAAAVANFAYKGGAVRLVEPVTDPVIRHMGWGHAEKDEYTLPFGPWSFSPAGEADTLSAGPWVYRYGTASAATGSRYSVLATRVHGDVADREGASIIVTVLSPWSAAYPFQETGYLDRSYVMEKLAGGRPMHGGDIGALTRLIGLVLNRPTVVYGP